MSRRFLPPRSTIALSVCAFLLLSVPLPAIAAPPDAGVPAGPGSRRADTNDTGPRAAWLVDAGAAGRLPAGRVLAAYPDAVLVELGADEVHALRESGVRVVPLEGASEIRLARYRFDTSRGEPSVPAALSAAPTGPRWPFIVQFAGPLHPDWRARLAALGAEPAPFGRVPRYAWIFRMSPDLAQRVRELPFVRWVGPWEPAYRLAPELADSLARAAAAPQSEPAEVIVELFDRADLASASEAIESLGGEVLASGPTDATSQLHPYVVATLSPAAIRSLAAHPAVQWIERRTRFEPRLEQASHGIQTGTCGVDCAARTADDVPWWRDGITGAGPSPSCTGAPGTEQIVGVLDSGIANHGDFEGCPGPSCTVFDVQSQLAALGGTCGTPTPVASCSDSHTSSHGTSVAGIIAGSGAGSGGETPVEACSYKGLAFGARLDFEICGADLECLNSCDTNTTLDLFFRRTYEAGSRISNHSWGASTGGAYTSTSETVDTLAWDNDTAAPGIQQEYLWVIAAGNDGPGSATIGAPATAKNGVSVAGVYNGLDGDCWNCDVAPCDTCDRLVCYSSRGPVEDGRHGPHIAGLTQCITAPERTGGYQQCFNGTSAATPTISGTVALIRDWWIHEMGVATPSANLVKASLLAAGEPITDPPSAFPDPDTGWGRVQLDTLWDTSNPDLGVVWLDETTGLATGETTTFTFTVRSGRLPLKAMLVWTDYPGSPGAPGLVNNLEFILHEPGDAACYVGNDLTGAFSNAVDCVTLAPFDAVNNDEGVRVAAPVPGTWTAEIRATDVPQGPQPFALVVSGDVSRCDTPPPPPANTTATPTAPNTITVSWDAAPGAARYSVYRSDGACPGGDFRLVGTVDAPATSFDDSPVSGGSTYSYVVRTRDAEGCVSDPSNCADATATGDCLLPPSFAGLVSVTDDGTDPCGLTLSWDPASSGCAMFPDVTYAVYRSTDPAFTPGPENLLASCVTGTTYHDANVAGDITYHYVVRAEDSRGGGGGGPCNGGNIEDNTVVRSGTPTGDRFSAGTFVADAADTTTYRMNGDDPWRVTNLENHTAGGLRSWHAEDWIPNACAALTTPPLRLDPLAVSTLTFWTRWDIHYLNDIGIVEISTDGGASWTQLTPNEGYPDVGGANTCIGQDVPGFGNVNPGEPNLTWTQYTIDLSAYAGQDVLVRFMYATDQNLNGPGWWIDDIEITNVLEPIACSNGTAACLDPPDFGGVTRVESAGTATCGLTVSWDAAASRCTQYPDVRYNVYRSTDPNFVPGPDTLVASCVTGTSYTDSDVFFPETYHYIVRAEDSSPNGTGPCGGGNEDANMHRLDGSPGGALGPGTFRDDAGDIEPQRMIVPDDWTVSDRHNHTPDISQGLSYWASTRVPYPPQMCSAIVTPTLTLGTGSTITFWDYEALDFEQFGPDGGVVEISTDGGLTWEQINDDTNSTGSGTDLCTGEARHPGRPMYSNWIPRFDRRQVPIPAVLDNREVLVRFRFMSTATGGLGPLYEGWLLDDIEISNVQVAGVCTNPDPACSYPPFFRGVVSATDGGTDPCSITVSWDAAESVCGAYTDVTYTVYRGTTADFVPGPDTLRATCVTGTSFVDDQVQHGETYYYVVRAEDSSANGTGPCNGGNIDANTRMARAVPKGAETHVGTWLDDAGDTYPARMFVPAEWSITTRRNHTPFGKYSYRSATGEFYEPNTCSALVSPPLHLDVGAELSFWTRWGFDAFRSDGGIIQVSDDGGHTWTKVTPVEGYPTTLNSNDCIGQAQRGFGGAGCVVEPCWEPYHVDLSAWDGQVIQFRFLFGSSSELHQAEGWYIDDIQVTNVWLDDGCRNNDPNCDSPPVFDGADQATTGTDPCSVTVSWHPGTPGCTSAGSVTYAVYKSRDPGFVPGPENLVASCLTTTSYTDNDVSHDIPEYYVVRAEDSSTAGTGPCNGGRLDPNVKRIEAIPSGPGGAVCLNSQPDCADGPVFSGLVSATNDETDPCSVTLAWDPATSRCQAGTGITYSVYRSRTQGFTPAFENRIASCVTGTTYQDRTAAGGDTFYYVVRAEDSTANGAGACNAGNEDANLVEQFTNPSGPTGTLFSDDFEAGLGNWIATDLWAIATDFAHSGAQSVTSGYQKSLCETLTMASPVTPPANAGFVKLSFWTEFPSAASSTQDRDLGIVQVSVDGGPWTKIFPVGGYPDHNIPESTACTGSDADGFTQNPETWGLYEFDLTPWAGHAIKVRFFYGTQSRFYLDEPWYIDDVEITYGGSCSPDCSGAPSAPASLTATVTAPEQVTLDWPQVAGAVRYEVRRGAGTCLDAAPTPLDTAAYPATSYVDDRAGAGGSWAYQVVAIAADECASLPSPCDDATQGGLCTVPPDFAGLSSADSAGAATCGIDLAWPAARSNCPSSSGVVYDVYRDTTPGVPVDAAHLVAACVAGTGLTDLDVAPGVEYSYRVQAEDPAAAGTGLCSGGSVDANMVERSTRAGDTPAPGDFFDDGGDTTPLRMVAEPPWQIESGHAFSGDHSWHAGGEVLDCASLTTPPIELDNDIPAELVFQASRNDMGPGWSGTTVEISDDGGATWSKLLLTPDYNDRGDHITCIPLPSSDRNTLSDYQLAWTEYRADLTPWQGREVLIHFRYGTGDPEGAQNPREGVYIDDVRITSTLDAGTCRTDAPDCALPPRFDGLASATSDGTASCGVTLSWQPASPACGNWSDVVYNVYRSTDPEFVPGQDTLLASCLDGTSYHDLAVDSRTTYYYVVRAEDRRPTGGAGACGTGLEDGNGFRLSVMTGQLPETLTTFFDDAGDTAGPHMRMHPVWHVTTTDAFSGTHSYFGPEDWYRCDNLVTPPIELDFGSQLTFQSSVEALRNIDWYAGGEIELSDDGGNTWTKLTPVEGYPAYYDNNLLCDTFFEEIFADNDPTWRRYTVDLDPWGGQVVQIRFHWSSTSPFIDPTIGWRLDDISISNVWLPGECSAQTGCGLVVDVRARGAAEACAGETLTFYAAVSGGSGGYAYQWTEDGVDIPGATSPTLTIARTTAQSHVYDVRVTDASGVCVDVSDPTPPTGTWTDTCAPDVVRDAAFDAPATLTEVCGDGDAIVEPGERWALHDRVVNAGNHPAGDVRAALAVNAASAVPGDVRTGAQPFGAIDPGFGATNAADRFEFCPAQGATCGQTMTFDLTDITWTGGGSPPNAAPGAFGVTVGSMDPGGCDVSSCCAAMSGPPPVGDGWRAGGQPLTMRKDGTQIVYDYDAQTCGAGNTAVVLYGSLDNFGVYQGAADCDGDGTFDASGLQNVWFLAVWTDGAGTAGHPGYGTNGPRPLDPVGAGCGIVAASRGDGRCD